MSWIHPQAHHRESRSGMQPGEPLSHTPSNGFALSKVFKALLLEGKRIKVWRVMAVIASTQCKQLYYSYSLNILVQPFEGIQLLPTNRKIAFGYSSVLCGIGKPRGYQQLKYPGDHSKSQVCICQRSTGVSYPPQTGSVQIETLDLERSTETRVVPLKCHKAWRKLTKGDWLLTQAPLFPFAQKHQPHR